MTVQNSVQQVEVSFTEALATAIDIAARCPSSHNCQPWALAHLATDLVRRRAAAMFDDSDTRDEFLVLAADRARELGALPAAHHIEMQLSCGLFWRLLQRALAAQGWMVGSVVTSRAFDFGELGLDTGWRPLRLIRLHRTAERTESLAQLRATTTARHTDRSPYLNKLIPSAILDDLAALGARRKPRVHVRYLISEHDRNRFVRFVARHAGRDFAHTSAWRETHSFIRRNEIEAQERGDGFTFAHLFGSLSRGQTLLRRVVLAPVTMRMMRATGLPRILAGQLATVVGSSRVVATLCVADSPTDDDLLTAGELLTDFWLHATDAGLVLHPISVVIQHEDLREQLQSEFALTGHVFFVARLGYSAQHFPPTPRRDPHTLLRTL
ncbi:hypothetical protein ACFU44_23485 [Nocardia rhizosphaerihabitans]|uniref:hypothetical protein n=1 Tax=Nocardia rhizosphaerihabitans TaxID=1691570 RepID=UPI00366BA7CE